MTDTIPVFVNERRLEVPRGATAAAAAALLDPAFATRPGAAGPVLTDARGLPVAPDAILVTGMILRVAISARRAGGADADA
ncbi:MAG TPA: hypothetical protein PK948_10955 [Gemmatimonadales bacterium]|jgi:hypothetical protein|nr:hypothetical protein [Gemmatimonadales bacterium]